MAETTIKASIKHMELVLKRCSDPTPEDIYIIKDMMIQEGKEPGYINKALNVSVHWFRMQGFDIKFKRLPESEGVIEYLEKPQIRLLFEAIDSHWDEHIVLRDAALTVAILFSGLRPSEVRRLKVFDVDIDRREITVRKPKNRHPDIAIIPKAALRFWVAWLEYRAGDGRYIGKEEMFLNHDGKLLKYAAIRSRYRAYWTSCGFKINATILRHTLGTMMKRAGADILDIKLAMRHRNIKSTMRYVSMDKEDLKRKVDKYLPGF